jgi:hypothetical protein
MEAAYYSKTLYLSTKVHVISLKTIILLPLPRDPQVSHIYALALYGSLSEDLSYMYLEMVLRKTVCGIKQAGNHVIYI